MSDTAETGTETSTEGAKPEGTDGAETTETPTVEELLAKVEELTGHSRKWEDRAKANLDAKKELDKIRREAMTDAEKIEADRAAISEEVSTLTQERDDARAELARFKVAVEFGLDKDDAEALSAISDEAALRSLAERLSGRIAPGTRPNPAQGRGAKTAPPTAADAFAEALGELF